MNETETVGVTPPVADVVVSSEMTAAKAKAKKPKTRRAVRKDTRGLKAATPDVPMEEGKRIVTFNYDNPGAHTVYVAGSFNEWQMGGCRLTKNDDGVWAARLMLEPGRYEYRLVVDGEWRDDPASVQTAANPYGSSNAVLTVEPCGE